MTGASLSFVAKCAPAHLDGNQQCVVFAPAMWGAAPKVGDRIYIWFAESHGGQGLAHRGTIFALGDEAPLSIAVDVDASCAPQSMTKAKLHAQDVSQAPGPLAGIAAKLYVHAHNKLAELAGDEAIYLDDFFGSPSGQGEGVITLEELTALEHQKGDGQRMYADTALYRLTTIEENPNAEEQRKPGTLRGIAAAYIRSQGGTTSGRALHHFMLKHAGSLKWDYGYVHARSGDGLSPRGGSRDWIRPVSTAAASRPTSRYSPFEAYLSDQAAVEFTLSFDEIEAILGASLPVSATRPQWWANTVDAHTNVQREAWRAAGYEAFLIAGRRQVRFVKQA
jgi:hypothetical protein